MTIAPSIVIAIYPSAEAGARNLRDVRRSGFRRSAMIYHRAKSDHVEVDGHGVSIRHWAIFAGLIVLALVLGYVAFSLSAASPVMIQSVLLAVIIAAIGVGILAGIRWLNDGVSNSVIDRYRRWVLPGEAMVLVQGRLDRAQAVLELFRRPEDVEPAIFVTRLSRSLGRASLDAPSPERFTGERLKLHATKLASRQRVARRSDRSYRLQGRVDEAQKTIEAIIADLTEVTRLEQASAPAAEWLMDNAYAIRRHSSDVHRNLSKRFYDVLPVLETDTHAGEPRVYEVAVNLVAHTDADVHEQDIVDFVEAYQEVSPLTISELWVLPLMLRLALIEHLSRLAIVVDRRQYDHERADFWANRLLNAARLAPDYLLLAVAEVAREQANPSAYVVDRLVSQLQGEAVALDPIRVWLERKFGTSLAEVIQHEQGRHAADQVTIANAIGSLRELSRLDWRDVFEHLCAVDRVLEKDPLGVYPRMDFGTRDRYRAALEQVARYSSASEVEVAHAAIEIASLAENDGRARHVGYYLVDAGRDRLEERVRYRPSTGQRIRRWPIRHPTLAYLGSIGFISACVLAIVLVLGGITSATGTRLAVYVLLGLLALLPASELAVQIVNYAVTRLLPPHVLPKLSFEKGIPDEWRTLVAVPTLLMTPETVRGDLEHLEVRFLANQDPNLHYALLADFVDAPESEMPEDRPLLEAAIRGVEQLNERHGNYFSLFYRRRVWSESEQVWMGWERKRGKLEELNRWLIGLTPPAPLSTSGGEGGEDRTPLSIRDRDGGGDRTPLSIGDGEGSGVRPGRALTLQHVGDATRLQGVRFVITLDADTQLPHGTACRLVGTLAHPLNRPQIAPDGQTVTVGYTIVQPRVSTSLPSANATRFSRLMVGSAGTDPYTQAISDVYQDLVREGTYHGKGIYDVEMFHHVLSGRFPDATLLSHDLLEGAHVRVGLASDIELLEHFPSTYRAYAVRQHRWIRGDWQIADWCTPRVPGAATPGGRDARDPDASTRHASRQPNPLSTINRWKILDNLRRSLLAPASVMLLVLGWWLRVGPPGLWSAFVGLNLFFPAILQTVGWLTIKPDDVDGIQRLLYGWRDVATAWAASAFSVVVLPYQAATAVDAIVRVWFRRLFSRRHLLQWQTAQMAHLSTASRERRFLWRVGGATLFSVLAAPTLLSVEPAALPAAAPFLLLWLMSPVVVAWLNTRRGRPDSETVAASDRLTLRRIARQTWRYFDELVGPQSNWLPPDNFQAALRVEVAQRTSPTNVGLWLLSTTAANDFGYLTIDQAVERALSTLETLNKLERFEGHLLNWYNIETLQPLHPRYVSTVDSGNLLASLWALVQGYRDMSSRPLIGPWALRGLEDTLELVQECLSSEESRGFGPQSVSTISDLTATLAALFDAPPSDPVEIVWRLRAATDPARDLVEAIQSRTPSDISRRQPGRFLPSGNIPNAEAAYWAMQVERQITGWLEVVDRYLPWLEKVACGVKEEVVAGAPAPGLAKDARVPSPLSTLPTSLSGRSRPRPVRGRGGLGTGDAVLPSPLRGRGAGGEGRAPRTANTSASFPPLFAQAPSLRTLASGEFDCPDSAVDPPRRTETLVDSRNGQLDDLDGMISAARERAVETLRRVERLTALAEDLADGMNLRFLYDPGRRLFTIGYNVEVRRPDNAYFDLLASEARLTSFVAIARGDAPVEHWFTLGRLFGGAGGRPALLSWTGTMFEYLMPLLLTRLYDDSLLDAACREAVTRQIAYGESRGVPWGISEAAFSAVDANQIYQYQAFGVPDLGLKRGLAADLVVAPYAAALALLVDPRSAAKNLKRLAQVGARGSYGFYDSIDYTPKRRPEGQAGTIVCTYMAHHQGMALLAIDNALHAHVMQARFHADPRVQAAEPLLFERMPTAPPIIEGAVRDTVPTRPTPTSTGEIATGFRSPDTTVPRAHLLANSSYAVMVTGAGSGYSRWHDFDVSRWRSDTTLDSWGSFCYVRDVEQGVTWSTTYQPIRRQPAYYSVTFKPDHAEFERRDAGIGSVTEIVVSPEDDAEIRRLTLVNQSSRRRQLEITSYVELALASPNADRGHPAFSKLFIQTEAVSGRRALLAWRKARSPHDPPVYAAHVLVLPPLLDGEVTYETDRAKFLGRGRGPENPIGLERPLSNSVGSVLDPVFCLRCRVTLEPGQRVQLAYVTGAAETREKALAMAEKFQDLRVVERAFDLAAFQAQLELRHLRITADDVQRFLHLASHVLFPNAQLRAGEQQLRQNRLGQSRLWPHGISGDLPIVLVAVGDRRDAEAVAEALVAHTFWRLRGVKSDLVILNEEPVSYEQPLQDYLKTLVQAHAQYTGVDQPGGIFLRSANLIPAEDLTLLFTVARAVVVAARGPLVQQLSRPAAITLPPPLTINPRVGEEPSPPLPFLELPYFNGLGGFTDDGREYAIYLGPGTQTPAPWVNVMANPTFGALVSESGQGFTWYGNSQGNRLLPWSNDPVSDPSGDALYIRDEESGRYWTPTALPIRELDAYRSRHGQGYTVYEHNSHAIEQELVTFVPLDDSGGAPVRVQRLRLRNRSSRRRRLSIIAYGEWVLGGTREETQMHVVSSWDAESQALLGRNAYHPDYGTRVAFASASLQISSYTADRTEFLGRNGSRATPAALGRRSLAGRTGAGLDPCAALQVVVEIDPNEATEITFVLGQAADAAQARRLVRRFRDPERVEQALRDTRRWWDTFLGTIQVETPVLGVNFLLNRWLPYQTLSCRFWARSAFYQSGGAFGFRDQLQDAMALVYAAPQVVRQHILVTAARQFVEGDVQHWWHPQSGGGVRTRISDDLLWLPYVTAHYVRVTGDTSILDEVVPFLEGHVLEADEHERYFVPATALEAGTLLEHCRRAIEKGLTRGPHGLPLIGTGDWNDGLNLVGAGGTGESVWLAWFLIDVLREFAALLEARGDAEQAGEYRTRSAELTAAVEAQAWDGEWYRRAYFDDGTPLGSKESEEAMIDSLPQSWAVISGAAIPGRAEQAMEAVERHLIRADDGLVLLFTPPFESATVNPGYIQGYPPGVRENGGQYTHGAVWVALAYARRGDGDRAVKTLLLLNPIEHARVPEEVERYKVEPYVVAADVYALEGHVGRGGWTWYTGSSGWMYRVWLEEILGFKLHGDRLTIDPVLPSEWDGFRLRYRRGKTQYEIVVENPDHVNHGVAWAELDGQRLAEPTVALQDEEGQHVVRVRMGR